MSMADNVEDILNEIGFGRWQLLVFLMTIPVQIVYQVQQLGSPLISAPVPFRCLFLDQNQFDNVTHYGHPNQDEIPYPSTCHPEKEFRPIPVPQQSNSSVIVINTRVTGLPSCPRIQYDTSVFQSTVVTEWNLVCESSSLQPLYQMAFSVGNLIGSAICGQLSDRLGRKRTLQMGSAITTLSILATSTVPWYTVMIALRIVSGFGANTLLFPAYTILSEVSPASSRTIANIVTGMVYFLSMAAFAGVGYLLPHWRRLLLLYNSPLILMILLTFMIDESPRWLIQKGRITEAVDILRKAAKKNGASLSSSTTNVLEKLQGINKDAKPAKQSQEGIENGNYTLSDGTRNLFGLVRTCYTSPGMRIILILSPVLWIFQRALYVGIAINANNFSSSNPFEYVAYSGAMGIIAMALSIPASLNLPRRVFLAGSLSTSGILMLLEMAVPSEYWMIKWFLVMVAFCLTCGAFQINYIYAVELYPTLIRTRGFTFNSLIAATGEMAIPLVTDIAARYYWWAASVTFGLAGIIGSFLLAFLPETKNLAMPETFQDVEDRYWRQKGTPRKETEISV